MFKKTLVKNKILFFVVVVLIFLIAAGIIILLIFIGQKQNNSLEKTSKEKVLDLLSIESTSPSEADEKIVNKLLDIPSSRKINVDKQQILNLLNKTNK